MLPSTRKPISVKPPRTEVPPLQLLDEVGDQPFERLARRFRVRRRLFQLEQCARRSRGGTAVSGSGLRPSARSSASTGLSASRKRRASERRSIPARVPMVFNPSRSSVRVGFRRATQRRDRRVGELGAGVLAADHRRRIAIMRQRPGRCRGRRHGHARRQPATAKRSLNIRCQLALAAEQVGDAGDVQPQRIRAIDLDQWRPAAGPARQPLDQGRVALRIGRNRD